MIKIDIFEYLKNPDLTRVKSTDMGFIQVEDQLKFQKKCYYLVSDYFSLQNIPQSIRNIYAGMRAIVEQFPYYYGISFAEFNAILKTDLKHFEILKIDQCYCCGLKEIEGITLITNQIIQNEMKGLFVLDTEIFIQLMKLLNVKLKERPENPKYCICLKCKNNCPDMIFCNNTGRNCELFEFTIYSSFLNLKVFDITRKGVKETFNPSPKEALDQHIITVIINHLDFTAKQQGIQAYLPQLVAVARNQFGEMKKLGVTTDILQAQINDTMAKQIQLKECQCCEQNNMLGIVVNTPFPNFSYDLCMDCFQCNAYDTCKVTLNPPKINFYVELEKQMLSMDAIKNSNHPNPYQQGLSFNQEKFRKEKKTRQRKKKEGGVRRKSRFKRDNTRKTI